MKIHFRDLYLCIGCNVGLYSLFDMQSICLFIITIDVCFHLFLKATHGENFIGYEGEGGASQTARDTDQTESQ